MPATGNEPVKLSQLKSVVPGIALRKFNFKITNVNATVQLPFAPDWGINVNKPGTYTAVFMDYGKAVQLLSLRSNESQMDLEIRLFYTGYIINMREKLANMGVSYECIVTSCNTNDTVFSSARNSVEPNPGVEGYYSRLQLVAPSTLSSNWSFLFINLIFEK